MKKVISSITCFHGNKWFIVPLEDVSLFSIQ